MLTKIVSGGQTGCDQGALRAARAAGVPTGGWVPRGWVTEDGPAPWLADFGLKEMATADYRARTVANVRDSDATLILCDCALTGGTLFTLKEATRQGKPFLDVDLTGQSVDAWVRVVCGWIDTWGFRVLNVAGPRESKSPGIGARAERFVAEVLRSLAGERGVS